MKQGYKVNEQVTALLHGPQNE